MYAPSRYSLGDTEAALDLVDATGFCLLITSGEGTPALSHLPMIADRDRRVLRGHLARANPHAALLDRRRHHAVFTGSNAYVSPNWYVDKTRVPTWNYLAVEIEGEGRVIDAPQDVDAFLAALAAHFERRRHDLASDSEWTMDKLPPQKLERLRRGIVFFEMQIERISAKAKLSQSDDAADSDGAIRALSTGGDMQRAVAEAMRREQRR